MKPSSLTRSKLIEKLSIKLHIPAFQTEHAVKLILSSIIKALSNGDRIEIRKFGSFEIREKEARIARNPKTGQVVQMQKQFTAHFKAGQPLRDRVNNKR